MGCAPMSDAVEKQWHEASTGASHDELRQLWTAGPACSMHEREAPLSVIGSEQCGLQTRSSERASNDTPVNPRNLIERTTGH